MRSIASFPFSSLRSLYTTANLNARLVIPPQIPLLFRISCIALAFTPWLAVLYPGHLPFSASHTYYARLSANFPCYSRSLRSGFNWLSLFLGCGNISSLDLALFSCYSSDGVLECGVICHKNRVDLLFVSSSRSIY